MMDTLHVVLYQPEIPPNTGNIIRLCANTGVALHLIEPLGFELDDARLKRAGLDYHEFASVRSWESLENYQQEFPNRRIVAIETSGHRLHAEFDFQSTDSLLFGSETSGLPATVLDGLARGNVMKLPMLPNSRSLNLSNAVAVVVYEAWGRLGFPGASR